MGLKKKILIVDDEAGFTEMVKLNLEATGNFEVRIENQGTQAIASALEYNPDLILLDIIMPDIEGPDILLDVKKYERLKNIPIIFLTATVTRDEMQDMEEGNIGGHVFVAKPSTTQELIECITHRLG